MKTETEKPKRDARSLALALLPSGVKSSVERALYSSGLSLSSLTDIRLRRDGASFITVGGVHRRLDTTLSPGEFDDFVFSLTGGSLFSHADTIREGYISVGGIRCGVCGRAALWNGEVGNVTDISSVSIRVPGDVPGCSSRVYELITRGGALSGALLYSPPGTGKTTLLRDLIRRLSADGRQLAVVDPRHELGSACVGMSADVLSGYPKDAGIVSAVRSLSPEIIICDELSGKRDAEAAVYSRSCGVPIVATAHAGTLSELRMRPETNALAGSGVFSYLVGLKRPPGKDMSFFINEP